MGKRQRRRPARWRAVREVEPGRYEIAEATDVVKCAFCSGAVFRVGKELCHTDPECQRFLTLDPYDFLDASIEHLARVN